MFGKTPPIVPATPKCQLIVANSVELALYALMIVLPLLGWVMLSAEGKAIPFFGFDVLRSQRLLETAELSVTSLTAHPSDVKLMVERELVIRSDLVAAQVATAPRVRS